MKTVPAAPSDPDRRWAGSTRGGRRRRAVRSSLGPAGQPSAGAAPSWSIPSASQNNSIGFFPLGACGISSTAHPAVPPRGRGPLVVAERRRGAGITQGVPAAERQRAEARRRSRRHKRATPAEPPTAVDLLRGGQQGGTLKQEKKKTPPRSVTYRILARRPVSARCPTPRTTAPALVPVGHIRHYPSAQPLPPLPPSLSAGAPAYCSATRP